MYGFFQTIISVVFKFRALTHDYTNSVEILTQLITNANLVIKMDKETSL